MDPRVNSLADSSLASKYWPTVSLGAGVAGGVGRAKLSKLGGGKAGADKFKLGGGIGEEPAGATGGGGGVKEGGLGASESGVPVVEAGTPVVEGITGDSKTGGVGGAEVTEGALTGIGAG